jgi:hypothetical protein
MKSTNAELQGYRLKDRARVCKNCKCFLERVCTRGEFLVNAELGTCNYFEEVK